MAGITLAQAQDKLDGWMAAEDAVMTGQEYAIGSKRLTRADLAQIRSSISYWEAKVISLTQGGGIRITGATPC